jgi:hypothetical protein
MEKKIKGENDLRVCSKRDNLFVSFKCETHIVSFRYALCSCHISTPAKKNIASHFCDFFRKGFLSEKNTVYFNES